MTPLGEFGKSVASASSDIRKGGRALPQKPPECQFPGTLLRIGVGRSVYRDTMEYPPRLGVSAVCAAVSRTWAAGSLGGRSLQRARETTRWVGRGEGHRNSRKFHSQSRGEERTPASLRFPSLSPLQPRPAAPGEPPTGRAGAGAGGGPRAGAPSLALLGALRGALGRECAALRLGGG